MNMSDRGDDRGPNVNAERLAETRYYAERLSAERLKRCYDIAPPRIQQYLDAEIRHVLGKVRPS
ncbi:MAG: hypothetical protein PVI86_10070, partial [Phycisphaerae bacterium]